MSSQSRTNRPLKIGGWLRREMIFVADMRIAGPRSDPAQICNQTSSEPERTPPLSKGGQGGWVARLWTMIADRLSIFPRECHTTSLPFAPPITTLCRPAHPSAGGRLLPKRLHLLTGNSNNRVPDSVQILIDLEIPDSKDSDSQRFNGSIAPRIALGSIPNGMRFTIEFDTEFHLRGVKVETIRIDAKLAAEFDAEQLSPIEL